MKTLIQSKKFLAIGSFTLSVLLLLVLSLNIKNVKADTTPTVTPTLVLENWFNTPTPEPLGSCPDEPVDPNHNLTTKYKNDCEQCLMTSTPAFPTTIPATSTGTVTAIPSATVTPTRTATVNYGLLVVHEQIDASIWTTPTIPPDVERHYVGSGHMPKRGFNFYNSQTIQPYKIGFQFWGSVNAVNWFNVTQHVRYEIWSTKSPLTITFYTGVRAGQSVSVPMNTHYITYVYQKTSGWGSWNETLDVQLTSQALNGYSLYIIIDRDMAGTDAADNYDIYYKYKLNGTFYVPPSDGYCRSEKIKTNYSDGSYFNMRLSPFWIGSGGCIQTEAFLGWMNDVWFQDLITSVFGEGQAFTLPNINLCFRQFSLSPLVLFGTTVDIMVLLYAIVGIYIVKTLFEIA